MKRKTIFQIMKRYEHNAPLINSMVRKDSSEFRTVVCYLSGSSDGNNEMEAVADKVIYAGLPKRAVNWNKISTLRKVAELIDEEESDLVVCQFRRVIPIGVFAAAMSQRKPKVIGVLHGIVGGKVGAFRKVLNFFIFRRLAKLVSVSESGIADLMRLNIALRREKLTAICNGIEPAPYLSPPLSTRRELFGSFADDSFLFVMVGRLAKVKNHDRVLQALGRLASERSSARLIVVGAGPLEVELKAQCTALGLDTKVLFLGYRKDVPEIVKQVDCYLMPSLREGFGMALGEAMAAGLPVVASNNTGTAELVPDSRFGYPVDPLSVDSIYQAMNQVMNSSAEQRRALGERARARILETFTAERMLQGYEQLYRDVLR